MDTRIEEVRRYGNNSKNSTANYELYCKNEEICNNITIYDLIKPLFKASFIIENPSFSLCFGYKATIKFHGKIIKEYDTWKFINTYVVNNCYFFIPE